MFSCNVLCYGRIISDGLGDLGHVCDLAHPQNLRALWPKTNAFKQPIVLNIFYLILVEMANLGRLRFVVSELLENGILVYPEIDTNKLRDRDQINDSEFASTLQDILAKNPGVMIYGDRDYSQDILPVWNAHHPTLPPHVKDIHAVISISTSVVDESDQALLETLGQNRQVVYAEIVEHFRVGTKVTQNVFKQVMGIGLPGSGICLSPKIAKLDALKILEKSDPTFFQDLLQKQIPAADFDKHVEFIPGYFQTAPYGVNFVEVLSSAHFVKGKNVVFCLNNNGFDVDLLSLDHLRTLGYKQLMVQTPDKITRIDLAGGDSNKPTVRIMVGYTFSRNGYRAMYALANRVGGCGGDKTLELVLSNGLLPFYQVNFGKFTFSARFEAFCMRYGFDIKPFMRHTEKNGDPSSDFIREEVFLAWQRIIEKVRTQENIFNHLPELCHKITATIDLMQAWQNNEIDSAKLLLRSFEPRDLQYLIKCYKGAKPKKVEVMEDKGTEDPRGLADFMLTYCQSPTKDNFIQQQTDCKRNFVSIVNDVLSKMLIFETSEEDIRDELGLGELKHLVRLIDIVSQRPHDNPMIFMTVLIELQILFKEQSVPRFEKSLFDKLNEPINMPMRVFWGDPELTTNYTLFAKEIPLVRRERVILKMAGLISEDIAIELAQGGRCCINKP